MDALRPGLDDVYAFLSHHLMPHAQAEERALYPVVQRVMGASQATATMSRDHLAIRQLTEELGALRNRLAGPALDATLVPELRRGSTACTRWSACISPRKKRSTCHSWMRA